MKKDDEEHGQAPEKVNAVISGMGRGYEKCQGKGDLWDLTPGLPPLPANAS
ncbi:MAG: hypothetical protein ACLT8E_02855 [Akkermansia sp.]